MSWLMLVGFGSLVQRRRKKCNKWPFLCVCSAGANTAKATRNPNNATLPLTQAKVNVRLIDRAPANPDGVQTDPICADVAQRARRGGWDAE